MPRAARVLSSTGYYHIIMRGQNRDDIFRTDGMKQYLLGSLQTIEQEDQLKYRNDRAKRVLNH